jgi:hypothetical protein
MVVVVVLNSSAFVWWKENRRNRVNKNREPIFLGFDPSMFERKKGPKSAEKSCLKQSLL